ncbi:uncharacterized protein J3D65DRAFT_613811 [Phyllosticta citribraziliensis]|uniref:Uncharacterized protein n=1 Tax=Phyllosticta citribraziliensis TaxID=989973 RepID=A0ABR1M4C3_9PEZI
MEIPQDQNEAEEDMKDFFVGFLGNFSDKSVGMVVRFDGVSDLTLHERRCASQDPERANSRGQLVGALDQILEECPRNTNNRKEWLGNAIDKISVDPTPSYESPLLVPGQDGHCETGRHRLELSLKSRFPLELVDIGHVCLGPRIGQHVIYLKMLYQFPKFLDLARELRDMVYKYLIVHHNEIFIPRDWKFSERLHLTMGLLTVSKQVHEESIELIYGENQFRVSIGNFGRFMQRLCKNARCSLKRLVLVWAEDDQVDRNDLSCLDNELWKLPQLAHLRFDFRMFSFEEFCAEVGLDCFFKHARRWFVEVARSKGDKFAALELISADFGTAPGDDSEEEDEEEGEDEGEEEAAEEGEGGGEGSGDGEREAGEEEKSKEDQAKFQEALRRFLENLDFSLEKGLDDVAEDDSNRVV